PKLAFQDIVTATLYVEDRWYLPVWDTVKCVGRGPDHVKRLLRDRELFKTKAEYFANALGFGTGDPKDRVVNPGFMWITLEMDNASDAINSLSEQVGWSMPGIDGECCLDRLYTELLPCRDFRSICACWSGAKSVHIHVGFDTRGLNATTFLDRKLDRAN